MPENLSSIMGGGVTPADAPAKKKLKKVGDYWEDEQGNRFADEAGTQPIKSEGEQAAAGAPKTSAMEPLDKRMGTAGWAVPGVKSAEKTPDWQSTPTEKNRQGGNSASADFEEYFSLTYPGGLGEQDKKALQDRWSSLNDAEKQAWLENARKKKSRSSVMG